MTHTLDICIGTLVDGKQPDPAEYIRQVLPHGFESFQITFWETALHVDLDDLAARIYDVLCDTGVRISSLAIFGNPLEDRPIDVETLQSWERLIDNAHLFDVDIVAGFTGRLRNLPLEASLPRFKEVFGPLAKRAAGKGIRIAFENCPMDGNWQRGDWNIAHNPDAWELMFDALPDENLGLEWEPCHQLVQLIDPLPQLRMWTPKIFHVHGKCATVKWDIVRQYGVGGRVPFAYHRTPGFGDCNWTNVISDLRQFGYTGSIDIEGWHDPVYRGDLEMTGQVFALNYLKTCRGGEWISNPT
jgi:sugar phosphate isomerase/epimerase